MSVVAGTRPLLDGAALDRAPSVPRDGLAPALDVVDLVREFSRRKATPVRALDGMSLHVPQGEVHGLLGPNGAGKTTLVKILSTVLLPTTGYARICGHDVVTEARAVRPLIGVVFGGDRGLYSRLSGRQNLEFWAAVQQVPAKALRERCAGLLDRLGLSSAADRRVETYSRGMRQRLHLARGLVADARVLFLDEPTMGMDPVAAREFRVLIGELRGEGRTIVIATHDMAEAEALCDRVSFVRGGKVIDTRSPRALADLAASARGVEIDGPDAVTLGALRALPGVRSVDGDAEVSRVWVHNEESVHDVLRLLLDRGLTSVRTMRPTLEDLYLGLIGDRGLEV
ncbi:ABC transporter ATP-binding protein [Amycolatopsis sp. GM8]|uniref:ABC transporter ATP-binding protein n=1 Tax=Amycolatopsis sp. GM8 TaxID=2896530 RepID=UPI001F2AB9D5|nr:ABC transporter ATP-binding protein [Amycolatopsis sp. GM8]